MSKIQNLLAGLGGAIALNILHESLKRKSKDMPRVDLLGEEALQKTLQHFDAEIDDKKSLYAATLAGDILSNTMYYGMIGNGDKDYLFTRAIAYGLAAGVGAVTLPKPLGLDEEPVAHSNKTKALTVGYYLAGALVTAGILALMKKKNK
ncbi:hypothetical protein HYN59_01655 [Flavobacterium album]|uniref:Uncharacterized protein n=1 Tax=Flavobacterium album TaxID=2175091 RepID=A0A2S1QTZ7_9FLAO|nr:hypothetical protein [Flavobacterium album]AWH83900.1 hypothetical protein HYN59_01655 [Flavobacterium album]